MSWQIDTGSEEETDGCDFVSGTVESELASESEFSDQPIDNMARRARTAPRHHRDTTHYCKVPPQADSICRARSATSQSFERSQTPFAICDSTGMSYRERATYEENRKRRFDHDCLRRYHAQSGRSPYRYEMVKHCETVQRTFLQDSIESEHHAMQERNISMLRYRAAVRDSWGHDAKIIKKDQFHKVHRCLRILAV
jgi:hypothetical protein